MIQIPDKAKFVLKNAEQVRNNLTMQQQKKIRKLYADLYQDITKQINKLGQKNLKTQNLVILRRNINERIKQLSNDIKNGIVTDMRTQSIAVVEDCRTFLKQCGFQNIHEAFQYVPEQIIENIYTGNVYQNGWTFSKAIWRMEEQNRGKINTIVSKGVAQGKSAYEVAKDVEKYVDTSASKQSKTIKWTNPKTGKTETFYFGKVDYNAQRLARTLISHAYQQSFKRVNENNPFVTAYIWHSAGIHGRTCDICLDRDGRVFAKDALPDDHPNGMCTFEAYIPYSMNEIGDKIADWYNSPLGTYSDLDKYAEDFID